MKNLLKKISAATGTLAATMLLAACAGTKPPEKSPTGGIVIERQSALDDYMQDTQTEYRVLGAGSGESRNSAIEAARKDAQEKMKNRLGELHKASETLKTEAAKHFKEALEIRADAPDMRRFNGFVGIALEKKLVRQLEERLGEKRLPPPLDDVVVKNKRFPAEILGLPNKIKAGETESVRVTPERDFYLTIFSYDRQRNAIVTVSSHKITANKPAELSMEFSVEDSNEYREENMMLFVLTTREVPFDAASADTFPCGKIKEWLDGIPPRERFIECKTLVIER